MDIKPSSSQNAVPRGKASSDVRTMKAHARQAQGASMDLGIAGKRAIVTGSSRGIGRATARLLLQEGVRVMLCARDDASLQAAREELMSETRGEAHAIRADMAREDEVEKVVQAAVAKLGGVDILVNNAGTMYSGRFAALNDEGLKLQLETKLFGFMRAIRLVYPLMRAQKWGRIVNLIGGAGKEPDPYMFGSGMTNSALLNLTKSLSTEFGEDNVLVNAVCPGWVDTNLWKKNAEGLRQELGVQSEEDARRLAAKRNALNRFGKPEELANAIAFLCSERASYITGVSLNLDGGRLKGLW
jgi:3-oxoacyl-[acyl-carrier protein] reductase